TIDSQLSTYRAGTGAPLRYASPLPTVNCQLSTVNCQLSTALMSCHHTST
ncbi:MAG: hypothetical protein HC849_25275, partial [Oscillatoriales cyanobacterium RU_3_3]|nr:hypothetical protein [Oscillatoriales cyanobacterium RU_3_3]